MTDQLVITLLALGVPILLGGPVIAGLLWIRHHRRSMRHI